MLSLPDFKEKQIVYILIEWDTKSCVKIYNDNIVYYKEGKIVNRVSLHRVFALFIIGDTSLTTGMIKKCMEHGVSVFLLKYNFEVYFSFAPEASGNYLLRSRQYSCPDQIQLKIAKHIIKNKIQNQCKLLKEIKAIPPKETLSFKAGKELAVDNAGEADELRGVEGSMSRVFFGEYFSSNDWCRREPRTKQDITNLLMDIGYTFLFNFMDSLLRLHGFDTYKGNYHTLFFQRRSLACDIMEPFRCLIDKEIRKAYNLKKINEKDFPVINGRHEMKYEDSKKYLKIFADVIMKNKESMFKYVHEYYQFNLAYSRPFPVFEIKTK